MELAYRVLNCGPNRYTIFPLAEFITERKDRVEHSNRLPAGSVFFDSRVTRKRRPVPSERNSLMAISRMPTGSSSREASTSMLPGLSIWTGEYTVSPGTSTPPWVGTWMSLKGSEPHRSPGSRAFSGPAMSYFLLGALRPPPRLPRREGFSWFGFWKSGCYGAGTPNDCAMSDVFT